MKQKARAIILALMLSVSVGCSTTDILKGAGAALGVAQQQEAPLVGVDTEVGDDTIQVGDAHSTTVDDVEGDVSISNDTINKTKNIGQAEQVNFYEMSPFALMLVAFLTILACIGWLLPSFAELRKSVKQKVSDRRE